MKNLVRPAAILCTALVCGGAFAQNSKPATSPAPAVAPAAQQPTAAAARPFDGWRPIPMDFLTKKVNITPEQVTKIKALDDKYNAQHNGLASTLTTEERRKESGSMMAKRDSEVKALLTAEQQAAYARVTNPTGSRGVAPAPASNTSTPSAPAAPAKR